MLNITKILRINNLQFYRLVEAIHEPYAKAHKSELLNLFAAPDTVDSYFLSRLPKFDILRSLINAGRVKYITYYRGDFVLTDEAVDFLGKEELLIRTIGARDHSPYLEEKLVSDSLCNSIQDADTPYSKLAGNLIRYYNLIPYGKETDRNFSIRKSSGLISYCPKGRDTILNSSKDKWSNDNRQEVKIGKGINKLLSKWYKFDNRTIELISNHISSLYTFTAEFIVVEGEDIRKYYHHSNHNKDKNIGSLGESCMRGSDCQGYFDIYVNNAKMLIAKTPDGIIGRALLWNASLDKNDIKFMDRIYGSDITIEAFKGWAKTNGYHHKERQSFCDKDTFVCPSSGNVVSGWLEVSIVGGPYEEFPYIDTLSYSNDIDSSSFTINNEDGDYEFNSTGGGYEGDDRITLHDGTRVHEDYARYVESEDEYYHEDDCVYSEDSSAYILEEDSVCINNDYYHQESDSIVYSECEGEYILRDDAVWIESSSDYIHIDNSGFCDITDEHIHSDDCATGTLPNGDSFSYNNELSQEQIDEYVKSRT